MDAMQPFQFNEHLFAPVLVLMESIRVLKVTASLVIIATGVPLLPLGTRPYGSKEIKLSLSLILSFQTQSL